MMTRIQTRLAAVLAAMLLLTTTPMSAQETPEDYVPYPQAFIGLQGGGQLTFSNPDNWKYITPTASISAGVHFTPVIGARLHLGGVWNKGGIGTETNALKYKYKYLTTDLDLMVNMVNLIMKGDYHPLNVYLIGGIGLTNIWGNGTAEGLGLPLASEHSRLSHNFRVGAMLDYKVARNWSVNLEIAGNSLNDRFNSKFSGTDDWQLTAQLGVAYRFGIRHKAKAEDRHPVIIADPSGVGSGTETAPADTGIEIAKPEPKQAPEPAPVAKKEEIRRDIFFNIRQTTITPQGRKQIEEVAEWLAKHPQAGVTVVGYADKGTGNQSINARLAKGRAEAVTKALVAKGIGKSRISTDSKGDTVQPFAENDRNRVTIVIGKE